MQPIRTVYSKLPNTLTIPEEFQNISAEVIIWPLEPENTESKKKRPFGLAKDIFEVPNTFFEPFGLFLAVLAHFGSFFNESN